MTTWRPKQPGTVHRYTPVTAQRYSLSTLCSANTLAPTTRARRSLPLGVEEYNVCSSSSATLAARTRADPLPFISGARRKWHVSHTVLTLRPMRSLRGRCASGQPRTFSAIGYSGRHSGSMFHTQFPYNRTTVTRPKNIQTDPKSLSHSRRSAVCLSLQLGPPSFCGRALG